MDDLILLKKILKTTILPLAGMLALGFCTDLRGQVLARPGWAGSGVAPESWWRHAVFYRIDPARFQASADGSRGDLAGVAQRLDYLQSLGVDAVVLEAGSAPGGPGDSGGPGDADGLDGLDDLIREASRYHLRLLLTVPAVQQQDHQKLLEAVHGWLSAGAAGVLLRRAPAQDAFAQAGYRNLVAELNSLLRNFPGERVLLADPAGSGTTGPQPHSAGSVRGGNSAQLTMLTPLPVQPPSAVALRESLEAIGDAGGASVPGLIRFADDPPTGSPDAAAMAAVLLASPGTAIFDFGDEIGLRTFAPMQAGAGDVLPVMQWTPLNVQQGVVAPIERAAPTGAGQGETPFGAYRPYIHPPPANLTGAAPASPRVTVDGNLPVTLPEANTLPGFTTGPLPNPPVEGDKVNVISEDREPNSLLNAYRQLIALHHGNPALRSGTQIVLNRDADHAVVWVRRAPAGSRTAASVIVAVNLGAQPVTLSLDSDLARAGVRSGGLRSLFTWSGGQAAGATMAGMTMAG
ncbi:MAG: DUF3459 domain-containing protein, partial [Janthinobacterium lividum]